jgi:hypothetical protein
VHLDLTLPWAVVVEEGQTTQVTTVGLVVGLVARVAALQVAVLVVKVTQVVQVTIGVAREQLFPRAEVVVPEEEGVAATQTAQLAVVVALAEHHQSRVRVCITVEAEEVDYAMRAVLVALADLVVAVTETQMASVSRARQTLVVAEGGRYTQERAVQVGRVLLLLVTQHQRLR